MKRAMVIAAMVAIQGCSGDDSNGGAPLDSGTSDVSVADSSHGDSAPADSAADSAPDAAGGDADAQAACPAQWTVAPVTDPSIALPDGGGGVLLHASATGTQDYTCKASTVDGGTTYAWTFVGPEADLADCNSVVIGHHFASDAGAAAPEWMTVVDNSYVIGHKLAAFTPDGGASAIPWLLLQATAHGGSGTLSRVNYVQRLNTTAGIAPSTTCDSTNVGTTQKVAYTADYYFYGQ